MSPFPKLARALSEGERGPRDATSGWLFLRYGRVAHFLRDGVTDCGKFRVDGKPRLQANWDLVPAWADQRRCQYCVDSQTEPEAK